MSDQPKKIAALISVLRTSVKIGVNAFLTPEDCRILLAELTKQRSNKLISGFREMAEDAMHEILEDLWKKDQ